ncbi:MAG: hypothetical protein ACRDV3_16660 [Acidothermaceae bacterium]
MPWWFWLIVAFIVLAAYVASTSNRLDRLHARLDATRAALDAQLVRRSAVTLEIAASALLDPATSVLLAGAAHQARAVTGDAREVDESALTAALRATFDEPDVAATLADDPTGAELLAELEAAATKVPLGRRFYNDAVRSTLAVRKHRVVRWLHLAGRVAPPRFFEMDDEPPSHLVAAPTAAVAGADNAEALGLPPDVD